MTGTGTSGDPYIIYTLSDLDNMRNDVTGDYTNIVHYELANDIDMLNSSLEEFPETNYFSFDGKGHSIKNLNKIAPPEGPSSGGLFGQLSNSTIKNLTLENCSFIVTSASGVGSTRYYGLFSRTMIFDTYLEKVRLRNCLMKVDVPNAVFHYNSIYVGLFTSTGTSIPRSNYYFRCGIEDSELFVKTYATSGTRCSPYGNQIGGAVECFFTGNITTLRNNGAGYILYPTDPGGALSSDVREPKNSTSDFNMMNCYAIATYMGHNNLYADTYSRFVGLLANMEHTRSMRAPLGYYSIDFKGVLGDAMGGGLVDVYEPHISTDVLYGTQVDINIDLSGYYVDMSKFDEGETIQQIADSDPPAVAATRISTKVEMQTQSTFDKFDFDNVWAIDPTINDGYPYLIENPPYIPPPPPAYDYPKEPEIIKEPIYHYKRGLYIPGYNIAGRLHYTSKLETIKTDLNSPWTYKFPNSIDIDYVGSAKLELIGDGTEVIMSWELLNIDVSNIGNTIRLNCPINNRKAFKEFSLRVKETTSNFKVLNVILNLDTEDVL